MKAYIDTIYGGVARVLFGEKEEVAMEVPVSELPRGANEGTVLSVKLSIDHAATNARKRAEGRPYRVDFE